MGVYNALNTSNRVTGASDWELTNVSESGYSYNCADIFRVEVMKGYYDLSNYTIGTPLIFTVWLPPFGYNQCFTYIKYTNYNTAPLYSPQYPLNYYVFKPLSSDAQWVACSSNQTAVTSTTTFSVNSTEKVPVCPIDQPAVMSETDFLVPALFSNSTAVFTVPNCQ